MPTLLEETASSISFFLLKLNHLKLETSPLDIIAPVHHGALMRLTINLDDELYAMARAHAVRERISLSKAISSLLRRQDFESSPAKGRKKPGLHPRSGFPVVAAGGRKLKPEEIRQALDDEDIGSLQALGLKPAEIKRRMK